MNHRAKARAYKAMLADIVAVLDRHDVLRFVSMGAPPDEYEPHARSIASRRSECVDPESCLELMWNLFGDPSLDPIRVKPGLAPLAEDIRSVLSRYPT